MSHTTTRRRVRRRNRWSAVRRAALVAATGVALTACAGQPSAPKSSGPAMDAALHDRLPVDIQRSGVLTVATDATYPPASFFGPDGRSVLGFEPDLADAMGDLLGVRVRFVVTDFVRTLDDVREGRADVVVSAMTDTADRERLVDFVNYLSAGSTIVVQRGNPHGITEIEDLCGQVVAVERGTVQVELLRRSQQSCASGRIAVRPQPTNADALLELRTGRAAAVLNDYPPAVYLATDPTTQADYQLASTIQYEPGLYGIGVPKDEPRLREALRAALERLLSTGEYTRILKEWGVAEGAVGQITVNAG